MNVDMNIASHINIPTVIASSHHLNAGKTSLLNLIQAHRIELIELLNQYGAVLFRGFACEDATYFSDVIARCNLGSRCSTSDYNIPRTLLPNDIYTSSDLAAHIPLFLHHEKPRSKNPPNHLYFCCVTPAQQGGGTTFANAERIWLDLPQAIQDKITAHGVLYKQFLHGKTMKYHWLKKILGTAYVQDWSQYFGTDEKAQIEKKLITDDVKWTWANKGHDLILLNPLPGALEHPVSKKILWFNSSAYLNYYTHLNKLRPYQYLANQYLILSDMSPMVCHYGNGQAFSADEITAINRTIQNHTCVLNWQKGDFMIVDNFTFMHGKQPHQGDRLLYSCMTKSN